MPDEPPRVFLSYGVRDASEIAERLRCELSARGYDVWQDVKRLRAGRPWDEDVPEGLRNSQVVLALLSPHSVRRALDAGNSTATDSVCLDEIGYARGARKIPIVPVQVVSCEAPFLVYRFHQIDFRRWRESESMYQAGLNQICAGIEAALRGETQERPWRPSLEPWDFAPFLLEKRNHFTGRQWLFRDLDEWRSKETPPALLITGEPGIGKSAIVAALVHNNSEGQVLAYHCCRADTPATLAPARFVRSLAGMLAARLEGYGAMLEDPAIKDAIDRADTDPASAFETAILSPLHTIQKTAGARRYLLIDALDEALMHPKRPTIVEVLAARINRLPPWLGIVATTRSEPSVLSQLRGLPAHALKADDLKNKDDVRAFLKRRLSEPGLRNKVEASGKTLEDVALGVLHSSAGNFLFANTAIDAVEGNQLRFDDLENQPAGRLSSLYEVFFNRLFRDAGIDFQPAGQVLEVVAAAREPLTREQIAAVTGLHAEKQLPPLLGRLAAFVPVREEGYSLFHRSLFEWLTGWDARQDQSFAGHYHLSLREGCKRLADWGLAEWQHGITKDRLYCVRHLPNHLAEAGLAGDLRTLLLNFNWLQTKLEATDVNALIADYDFLADEKEFRLLQSAIRLSAHVVGHDPRQLAGQLIGRLLRNTSPSIQALLKEAAERKAWPWLRPLKPCLTEPGGPLIRTLEGHMKGVRTVAVTPDGRRAVSGSFEGTVRLWDLESARTIRTLEGDADFVNAVAVTPDGRRIVSVSGSRGRDPFSNLDEDSELTLRLWELESGQMIRLLEGHSGAVNAVAVTPDGLQAVSASDDNTLRLWDLESGQTLRTLKGHTECVTAVAITPDGRRAVSGSDDQTLRLWDLSNSQTIRTFELTARVLAVAVTPDGRRAVSGSVVDLAVAPTEQRALKTKALRLWDLQSGQCLRTLVGHTADVNAVAVTPDGRRAVSGSNDATLRVWDLDSGQLVRTLQGHSGAVNAVAVTPDGRQAVSASSDKTLRLWDLESDQTSDLLECDTHRASIIAVTTDGRSAVSGSFDGMLQVCELWDLSSGQILRKFRVPASTGRILGVTPDGRRAVSASQNLLSRDRSLEDNALRLWDLESGQTLRTLKGHTECVTAVAITPDGRRAVSASGNLVSDQALENKTLRLWDLESGRTLRTLKGHTSKVKAVAVTPDGCRAVSGSDDKTLRLWDLKSGQTLRTLECHAAVGALAITPDGRRAVSASENLLSRDRPLEDNALRLWDLESGQTVCTLEGHTEWVTALAITPDGRRVVSASCDQTLRLWDLRSGKEIATFTGDSLMRLFPISPDGQTIIVDDGLLRIVEADGTMPTPADVKVPPLLREQQSLDKPKGGEHWRFWKRLWDQRS
jgi:WD40 repeat protein